MDCILKTLSAILEAVVKWTPTIGQQVVTIVLSLLKIIADNIGKFVESGVNIVVGFVKGVADSLPKVIDAALKLIVTFINGLADAIRSNSGAINAACLNLVKAIVDAIWSFNSMLVDAGKYVVEGFVKGIGSMIGKVIDAGKNLGRSAYEAAKKALDINSPSKEFGSLGYYSAMGYIVMLKKMTGKVAEASANMGSNAIDSMSDAISGIVDIANTDINSQPVITPVIDLTNVKNGTNQLYGMMSGLDSYNINGSVNTANSTARSIKKGQSSQNTDALNGVKSSTIDGDMTPKQPAVIQLVLQNGRAISEFIIDDIDELMGSKNKFVGRMVGQS